jgi:hypothetical protein
MPSGAAGAHEVGVKKAPKGKKVFDTLWFHLLTSLNHLLAMDRLTG